jgi:hypothetical protein
MVPSAISTTTRGRSDAKIADGLGMAAPTVEVHVSHVLAKLNPGNRTQIALLVHDASLVRPLPHAHFCGTTRTRGMRSPTTRKSASEPSTA